MQHLWRKQIATFWVRTLLQTKASAVHYLHKCCLTYTHTHTVICVLFQKGNAVYESCDLKNQWENIWTDMLFKKSTEHRVRAKNNLK